MGKEKNKGPLKEKQITELEIQTNEKLKQAFEGTNHKLNNNVSKRKFSEIFISFISPRIDFKKDDEEQIKSVLNWGAFVWNIAVAEKFPEHPHSETMNVLLPIFNATTKDKDLISKFILRKEKIFSNDDFFIMHYEIVFDKKRNMSTSVAVLQIKQ